jgi:DNA-binding response OmpR family regulator
LRLSKKVGQRITVLASHVLVHDWAMTKLLVVDGFDESRDAVASKLRAMGFDVTTAADEDDVAADAPPFDIAILDLPIAETMEAAQALRSRARAIIALAHTHDSRPAREAGHAAGVDYYVLRPCPPAELVKLFQRLRLGAQP